jgi:hypothetical protein
MKKDGRTDGRKEGGRKGRQAGWTEGRMEGMISKKEGRKGMKERKEGKMTNKTPATCSKQRTKHFRKEEMKEEGR